MPSPPRLGDLVGPLGLGGSRKEHLDGDVVLPELLGEREMLYIADLVAS
jgi:hypothetical protein